MAAEIRLVLVDDHTIVREGVRRLLEVHGFAVVGEAADGAIGIKIIEDVRPDIALIDVNMPGPGPTEIVTRLRHSAPEVRVAILSMHAPVSLVRELEAAGAAGYFVKHVGSRSLAAGLRALLESDDMISLIPDRTNRETQEKFRLTPKETELLKLLAQPYSNGEIAQHMFISEATVKRHLTTIYSKLGVRSRLEALVKASREGIVEGPP